jgi:hypothetical protein
MTAQNHTDITLLVKKTEEDVFNSATWGRHESAEPFPAPKETPTHIEVQEIVEHQPDADVQEYVEQTSSDVAIPADLKEIGVQSTHVVQYPHFNNIHVPLSDDKIIGGLKRPIDSAMRWLAEFCKYLLWKAHIRLKIAHGKAERVFEK